MIPNASPSVPITARSLRQLGPAARQALLEAAAASAEREYRSNTELTAFEAFGREDLHGESTNAEAR